MKSKLIVDQLSALAQEKRLAIFRLLVEAGGEGMAAGEIADALAIPNATLSFHLKELSNAGLVLAKPASRHIFYAANYDAMNALVEFLTKNCCGDAEICAPQCRPARSKRKLAA
jgi:DNA-binding transcriptional ArsR family regulator